MNRRGSIAFREQALKLSEESTGVKQGQADPRLVSLGACRDPVGRQIHGTVVGIVLAKTDSTASIP